MIHLIGSLSGRTPPRFIKVGFELLLTDSLEDVNGFPQLSFYVFQTERMDMAKKVEDYAKQQGYVGSNQ